MIVSCADPRVVPESIFGLNVGEAIVIRNAGGNLQQALPELLAIDTVLKLTDVVIIRHTGKSFSSTFAVAFTARVVFNGKNTLIFLVQQTAVPHIFTMTRSAKY